MKKNKNILLLEDTDTREELDTTKLKVFENTTALEVILGSVKCNSFLDEFMLNIDAFEKYDTIIIHASIYKSEQREKLFDKLKELNKKEIVVFSGNSGSSFIKNTLVVSAKSLYQNLEVYLNEDKKDILMLQYGQKWKLNILLNILEKINIFIEENTDEECDFDEFEDDIDLLELKILMSDESYLKFIENNQFEYEINREQIIHIKENINNKIQELL